MKRSLFWILWGCRGGGGGGGGGAGGGGVTRRETALGSQARDMIKIAIRPAVTEWLMIN